MLLKATKVDGIYTADPKKDPAATKYDTITYQEAIAKQLKVMDLTAFTLAMERKMPVVVFNMQEAREHRPGRQWREDRHASRAG